MTTPLTWPLIPDPTTPTSTVVSPPQSALEQAAAAVSLGQPSFVGRGIRRPFMRDQKNDLATAEGIDLIKANIGQVLGTKGPTTRAVGELPWRTEFGSRLHLLRHSNNTDASNAFASVAVQDAVQTWEPRARITSTKIEKSPSPRQVLVRATFDVVELGGRVVASGLETAALVTTSE
jgi:phage baseplate assembly protein W